MLMYKEEGGYHNFQEDEVVAAKADGWRDAEQQFAAALAAKRKPAPVVAKVEEPATIAAHVEIKRRGRPRREEVASTDEV